MPVKLHEGATIDDYRISRQEEAESLAHIQRYIVPIAVEYFEVNKVLYGRRKNDVVDSSKIASNLRKIKHHHAGEPGNPADEADYIVYEGYDSTEDFWPPTPFQFVITKDHGYGYGLGSIFLVVGYKNPLKRGETITTIVKKTKHYPTNIKEGGYRRRQQKKVPISLLSKREKDEAFHHLKLIVVPKAVNNTNAYLIGTRGMSTPQVTVEEALKTLKKKSDDGNIIMYQSEIPGKATLKYIIEKKNTEFVINQFGKPTIYIGFYSPQTFYPHQWSIHSGPKSIRESLGNTEIKPVPQITKKEELWALSLLKKHYTQEFPEIGKYLRKINIHPTVCPEGQSDRIQYEYQDGKKRSIFSIVRTPAGIWICMTPEGERHSRDCFNINVQNSTLKEAFEKPNVKSDITPTLTKKQELYALDIIKKQLLPKDLESFNNNISNIKLRYKTRYQHSPELKSLTLEQALKLIHKTLQGEENDHDFAMYIVHGPNAYPSMHYFISKNTNGSISIYYEELIQKRAHETVITL